MTETSVTPRPGSDENDDAVERVATALRGEGLWKVDGVWLEFATLPSPGNYPRLRQLWLDSPKSCRNRHVPMAVVARAAMLAGEHTEARLLLRKATLCAAKKHRRLKTRLRRALALGKRPQVAIAVDGIDAGAETRTTLRYLELYNAVATRDKTRRAQRIAELTDHGEGEWLTRL